MLTRYGAADGGLLADGLAFQALFAIVPAVLLAVGITGLVVSDPARRTDVVQVVASVLPPLRELMDSVLAAADQSAAAFGVIGAVTLAWSSSRFVVSFGDAISRVMGRTHERNLIVRNVIALAVAVLLPVAILGAAALGGAASFLDAAEAQGNLVVVGSAVHLALAAIPGLAIVAVLAIVYRVLPTPSPAWRAVLLPALADGVLVTVLAQAFAFLAPRFIGAAALLGTLAAVFAALAWLGLTFQAILLGAAWVGERDSRRLAAASPAPPGSPVGPPPGSAGTPPGSAATPPGSAATPPGSAATPPGSAS